MTGSLAGLRLLALAAIALVAVQVGATDARAAPTFPPLTGRVVDQAHVLPAATVSSLDAELAALEAKTSRQLVVVTLPSLQGYDIADYGYQLGRAWGLGQKGLNNGALLIVAPNERKVRIEVGYGLEPVLTDALSSVILQTQVLPRFKTGDIPGGVTAGTKAIVEQLSLDPSTAEQRVAQAAAQAQARSQDRGGPDPIAIFFVFIFVVFMLRGAFGGGLGGLWLAPLIFGGGGGGRRWGDGGGGGGFSGGGGSFGGGGASGSW
jgi:uncharacterized protein